MRPRIQNLKQNDHFIPQANSKRNRNDGRVPKIPSPTAASAVHDKQRLGGPKRSGVRPAHATAHGARLLRCVGKRVCQKKGGPCPPFHGRQMEERGERFRRPQNERAQVDAHPGTESEVYPRRPLRLLPPNHADRFDGEQQQQNKREKKIATKQVHAVAANNFSCVRKKKNKHYPSSCF